ncbi:MAG: hypothetical protein LUM44_05710 [Pyrinomonadaceae bacterium]|nr:hypothetical protein [Pyrinomonadaceae bacterium]
MKSLVLMVGILLFSVGNIFTQDVPGVANGSVGRNSRDDYDNGIRMRSIQLERAKRENYRQRVIEIRKMNYAQIKKDFELLQKLQSEIVKTYVTGKEINYKRIGELASKVSECAKRLDANLSLYEEDQPSKSKLKESELQDIKNIIVVLDKSVGNFVTSPIFQNLNVIETKTTENAETELRNIIRLSFLLEQKSKVP